jgi:GntR family transcriptional regulator
MTRKVWRPDGGTPAHAIENLVSLTAGPVPLYFQLARDLRQQISTGRLKPGAALPTEERLCELYGVSRITVRRAVDDLITEGLVTRRRGIGTFVAQPRERAARSVSLVGSLYEALAYPSNIAIEVLQRSHKPAPKRVAELLELEHKTSLVELQVLSRAGHTPFAMTHFYLPADIGAQLQPAELGTGTPVARLVERLLGEEVVRAVQTVEPESADARLARLLEIPLGTAVLHVLRTYFSASGRPVEVASVRYRPDQYRLRVDLLPR